MIHFAQRGFFRRKWLNPSSLLRSFAVSFSVWALPVAAAEFGGVVTGAATNLPTQLTDWRARGDLRWLRTARPEAADAGFDLVADLRYRAGEGLSSARDVLPDDLLAVYWRCRTNLPVASGRRQAWEVWNEPDFYFVRDQAHAMAAVLKACWWGVKAGSPEAQVLMPSLAFRPGRYALELVRNGALGFTDGWNWHFYGWAPEFRPVLGQQREFFRLFGREFPVWITEAGWFSMPAALAHKPEQLARQAAFHERVAAEAVAEGVDRHLAFALTAFAETGYDLGLTAPDGSSRPALDRFLELSRELAGATPRHELIQRVSGERAGLGLQLADGRFWTLLWSPGRLDERAFGDPPRPRAAPLAWSTRVTLPGEAAPRDANLTPAANAAFTTDTAPFPVAGCDWQPWSPAGVQGRAIRAFLRRAARDTDLTRDELESLRQPRPPSPVVVQVTPLTGAANDKAAQAYAVAPGGRITLRVRLHNFSAQPRRGRLQLHLPQKWPGSAMPAEPLVIAPLSWHEETAIFQATELAGSESMRADWWGDDGSRDSALLWFSPEISLRPRAPISWDAWQPPRENPAQWQPFLMDATTLRLVVESPEGAGRAVLAWARLPRRLAADDFLTGTLRLVKPRPGVYVQPFLATPAGEQTRHGELEEIPPGGLFARWRAGDFGPTIWSRVDSFGLPDPRAARLLVLRLQGLHPGEELELVDWAVATPAAR
ncbi:MAG: hypothetical protein ACKVYV_09815 [Limisphaerales bacterium]